MKASTKLVGAFVVAGCAFSAHSRVENDATQSRTSASERVPLVSLVMPALQELGAANKVAEGCFALLSNPTVKLLRHVEVKKDGRTMNLELDSYLSSSAGKLMGCSAAISQRAEAISKELRGKRPTREQAVKIVKATLGKFLVEDYKAFQAANQQAYDAPVMIAKGNNGYSREFVAYNDVVVTVDRHAVDPTSKAPILKTLIDGGENSTIPRAGNIREIITDGVFSFYTNPITVASMCTAPGREPYGCDTTYSVKFDGYAVDIRKNGQRWFDSEVIGGAIYAIELSGEKSTSTTRKVER